jgi:hypothetical protein
MNMILEKNGIDPNAATKDEKADAKKAAQEQYLAVAFLRRSDRNRYGQLLVDLENAYTRGNDRYPKTVTSAYSLLTNFATTLEYR